MKTISSAKIQNQFGGVVPEIAAREHEKVFILLIQELFDEKKIIWSDIEYIAYTSNPGLINCLLVGKVLAQTLGLLFNKKVIPVNHIYGHIFSIGLTEKIKYPFLSLVVSGKTTAIYKVLSPTDIEELDSTKDNAIGETYDKLGRAIGLPYPAGPEIDKLFDKYLPVPLLLKNHLDPKRKFSFSGIMTASINLWKNIQSNSSISNKKVYVSTVFQRFVIMHLIKKINYFSNKHLIKNIYISGGVGANKFLNEEIKNTKLNLSVVDKKYAGDNAAMIAYYASLII